ncbi:MAG: HNH endonuclease [Gammaproteobacteria bacterium]|nr:HNH endonuclease [Gammaproteobacteria bacterium]
MKLTAKELLRFAKEAQNHSWETMTGKTFKIEVRKKGIGIIPSTGKPRQIANSEIVEFCCLYSANPSLKTTDYKDLFNKSYLVAIVSKYDPAIGEIKSAEESSIVRLLKEGATKQVHVNAYERNTAARVKCIEAHGSSCVICDFNFEEHYGSFAAGFIHVHHLNPLAETTGERVVDPVKDLRPVCPNCHSVIHMRGGCLSIEEIKGIVKGTI